MKTNELKLNEMKQISGGNTIILYTDTLNEIRRTSRQQKRG